jgi:predicted nucleic acid-binding protein
LLEFANIYFLEESIAEKAIQLKRDMKIKLADAVIAATAILNNLKLATRNVVDFRMIKGLEVNNPFE